MGTHTFTDHAVLPHCQRRAGLPTNHSDSMWEALRPKGPSCTTLIRRVKPPCSWVRTRSSSPRLSEPRWNASDVSYMIVKSGFWLPVLGRQGFLFHNLEAMWACLAGSQVVTNHHRHNIVIDQPILRNSGALKGVRRMKRRHCGLGTDTRN